jgi:serine/threonine protein kinase
MDFGRKPITTTKAVSALATGLKTRQWTKVQLRRRTSTSSYSPGSPFFSMFAPSQDFCIGDQIGDFTLVKELAAGPHSRVFVGEDPTLLRFALKIINKSNTDMITNETSIWSRLHHESILEMENVIQLDDLTTIIVSELASANLLDYIPQHGSPGLSESTCQLFFGQLIEAIAYLEEQKIVHRDIKLENILIDNTGHLKLADFGLALDLNAVGHYHSCVGVCCSIMTETAHLSLPRKAINNPSAVGSLHYCAPEHLQDNMSHYASSSDIWSAGCVLYAMVTGKLAFNDSMHFKIKEKILNFSVTPTNVIFDSAKEIINGIFQPVSNRWDTKRILSHPWIASNVSQKNT